MRYLKYWMLLALAVFLAACGGGGNPGSSSSTTTTTTTTTTTSAPAVALSLVNAAGTALTTNAISKSANYYAKAVVTSASGSVLANQLVTFSTTYTIATLAGSASDATALTDSNGVAKVLISPLSLTTTGAASLTAAAYVGTTSATASLSFSTSAANVTLSSLAASPASIAALGTSAVSVVGMVDGVAASGVVVNFSANCGTFSPSSVTTPSSGVASSTYQSLSTCGGTSVTLTASAAGATDVTSTVAVAAARATNILFDSVTSPSTGKIFVSNAASGVKNATLRFKVVDSSGTTGLASRAVSFSLSSTTAAAGVTFSSAASGVTTDSSGYVSVTVASGSVPVPVVVTATLDSDSTIKASSNSLSVTSGVPSQLKAVLEPALHSLEALSHTGLTTTLTFSVSDRSGNNVPDGTAVTFVAASGNVTGSCTLTNSLCTVTYRADGTAPANGRDIVLAYLNGEEGFVDANGDGVYTSGETFYPTGTVYKDVDGSLAFSSGDELVPGGTTGTSACASDTSSVAFTSTYPSVGGTCNSAWSGAIKVRKQTTITWAKGSGASITLVGARTAGGFSVLVQDSTGNGNAMPSNSTVAAAITSTSPACTVTSVTESTVSAGATRATTHKIDLSGAADCTTVAIQVSVTSPLNTVSRATF
jgi:hypothetical protein